MPHLEQESAAFLWFNSRQIADEVKDTGGFYGAYAYRRLLPLLSPKSQNDPAVWFAMMDGDCMVETDNLITYFRPDDRSLLEEAKQVGESLCYVIAVMRRGGTKSWAEIDGDLRDAKTMGYMGTTIPAAFNTQTFLNCAKIMALPVAARIDGDRFTRISFQFLSDQELKEFGFASVIKS
jgi:hypothetical protein